MTTIELMDINAVESVIAEARKNRGIFTDVGQKDALQHFDRTIARAERVVVKLKDLRRERKASKL